MKNLPGNKKAGRRIPSDLIQLGIVLKYSFLESRRSNRFWVLLSLMALISIAATAVIGHFRPVSMMSSPLEFFQKWFNYTIMYVVPLPAIFLGSDAISSEFQNKTAYSMIGNPLKRGVMFLGKFLAAFSASLIALAIFEIVALTNGFYYFGTSAVPYQFWTSSLCVVFYLLAALALAFFFSSVFKNGAIALFFNAVALLVGFTVLGDLFSAFNLEPWPSLDYDAEIIANNFVVPYPQHAIAAGGNTYYSATIPEGLAVMTLYVAVFGILSWMIFRYRELA
jgi:ABC-2 type transport system permease protein